MLPFLGSTEVIRRFLPIKIDIDGPLGGPGTVRLQKRPTTASVPASGTEDTRSALT